MSGDGMGSFLRDVEHNKTGRDFTYKNEAGDLVSGNSETPNGDFSRFLGFKPPTAEELAGKGSPSSQRVIELALQRAFNEVGGGAMKTGMLARNQYISHGPYENMPGRAQDMVKDGLDSVKEAQQGSEPLRPGAFGASGAGEYMKIMQEYHVKSSDDNMRYLEMQYKFLYASKSHGTISTLMKVRHEATRSAIRDVK